MAATVALVGATHPAARALALALETDDSVERVLGLARSEPPVLGPKLEYVPVGEAGPGDRLHGADTVVIFPQPDPDARDQAAACRAVRADLEGVLHGAAALGISTLVLWSSGLVYGAHPDNPVPIGEDHPPRPNPGFPATALLAELEQLVLGFGDGGVVLRAAPVWTPEWGSDLGAVPGGRALQAPFLLGVRGHDPAVQALHPDDATSALTLAVRGGLHGVYNVAPRDWLPASQAADTAGRRRLTVPEPVAAVLAEQLWNLGVANNPPGVVAYHMHPWVLDAGRLRAAGWSPTSTSAQALAVAGSVRREDLVIGRVTLTRGDLYRSVGAGLATMAMLALARRRAGRR